MTLKDKVALVVGGSSGIGRGAALALAAAGARVVVAARREAECRGVADAIRASGGEAVAARVDVAVPGDIEALVATAVERWGRLDCAVNSAGISEDFMPIADADDATFDRMMAVNVKGTFLCMKHEIRQMVRQGGGGSVVNLSSILGHVATPSGAIYVATKHAVEGLTKSAALCYAKQGIRVNAVAPTVVTGTEMVDQMMRDHPGLMDPYIADIPAGRPARVEEVARVITWLCSDDAAFVNGHSLPVDGGQLSK
ncbi:short-chain dehydrogenase [Sorangium cellulosum]|uniref:Short-chain dehydrogenase n=1 Tax=Sorangium cellulosum TaxID=56 RepID=A0A2L0ETR5_SORCE|nr:glucose 1-dehydrogenase [Sorangium cellulosum]AUX42697.1 short-chain dehydrogenase [Sorangium cellulosum]